ncbi:MAG TPA: DUF4296 domain-containing protein [Ohtaekwangia sp.]|nr:DUF4296 domain-containing protein [Ohtaekwangia sp.]
MRKSIVMIMLLAVSCGERETGPPPDLLSREKMVAVMVEMYVVEEKTTRLELPSDSSKKVFDLLKARLYTKTGVADSTFKKSFDYYMNRPQDMELIYTALVDTLNLKEQRATVRQAPEKE